jgi:putative transposase
MANSWVAWSTLAWPCLTIRANIGKINTVTLQEKHKTCRRINEKGHAHSLTFSCFRRQPFLARDRVRRWVIDAIELARRKHDLDIWAYVIMPEHLHLLVYPQADSYFMSRILTTLKQPVSKRAILYVHRHAPEFLPRITDAQPNGKTQLRFWQRGGGYDKNLWSPRYVWQTIDYIHVNPVRRGLCVIPTAWPWSSARAYAGDADVAIKIDFDSLPHDPRRSNAAR